MPAPLLVERRPDVGSRGDLVQVDANAHTRCWKRDVRAYEDFSRCKTYVNNDERHSSDLKLTNVTPNRYSNLHAVTPDYGVHAIDEIGKEKPCNHGKRGNIARSPMPWQRD